MNRTAAAVIFFILVFSITPSAAGIDATDLYVLIGPSDPDSIDASAGLTIFPILLIPLGGKYEGMGTAFTAVANDASYMEANPSGSAQLDTGELVFVHNEWISDSRLEGVVYTVRFGELGIGVGGKFLYVPFGEKDDWGELSSKGYYSETVATMNLAYNFFSSYDYYGLSVGTNVKVAYRNIPQDIYAGQSAFTAMADVGLLTRLNLLKFYSSESKNLSVGGVVKNLGLNALGESLPSEATMGLAYSPIKPVTVSFDATKPLLIGSGLPASDWGSWIFAGGTDIVVADFFSVQGGFQYRGSNPRITLGGTVDLTDVSFVANLTLDMATQIDRPDRFSVAAKLNLGDKGRMAQRQKVKEYYANGLEAFSKDEYVEAIEWWEKALTLDPDFRPARDYIDSAKKALEIQQDLLDLQQTR